MLSDYARPWKISTLLVGIALLIAVAFYYDAPDWDVPISLIMAFLAYLTAPWSMHVLVERRWKHWPAMLLATHDGDDVQGRRGEYQLPHNVVANSFLNIKFPGKEEEKISKSRGTAVCTAHSATVASARSRS